MTTVPDKLRRRGTLRDLRTAVTARIRSKPTIEGQRFLDLYVLQRDRFRWKRLIQQAECSIQGIDLVLRKLGFNPDSDHPEAPPAPAVRDPQTAQRRRVLAIQAARQATVGKKRCA